MSFLPALPRKVEELKIGKESLEEELQYVDAQRIISILNEMEKKMELFQMTPLTAEKKIASVFTVETIYILNEFRKTEKQITESDSPDTKTFLSTMQKTTKNMFRHFNSNPTALNKLKMLSSKAEKYGVLSFMIQFKKIIYEKLKTSPEQEQADQLALESIVATEKKMREDISKYGETLDKLNQDELKIITEKNGIIQTLKGELRNIRKIAEESNRKLELKSKTKESHDLSEFQHNELEIVKEIQDLSLKHHDTVTNNRDDETLTRKKKAKVESEVENWILKYDQDMGEKQSEIDELVALYLDEKQQLDELSARFDLLKLQYNDINSVLEKEEAKKREERDLIDKRNKSAIKIQALMRGYIARKRLREPKSAKGKGKK